MTTVIKTVKKYGNSGGVYLPSEWIGGQVEIDLVERPLDPKKDLLRLPLEHIISVIAYGSYARGEMAKNSDVDLIVIVDDISKAKIPAELKQKYDMQIKSSEQIKRSMIRDPIFYKSIKDGSIALMNPEFLDRLKSETKPDLGGIKIHIDLAESALGIVKTITENYEDPTDMIYSIIMHLKEMLILECLLSDKKYTTKLLVEEIMKHATAKEADQVMHVYRSIRDDRKYTLKIPEAVIFKLISALEAKIKDVKEKANKKRH